MSSSPFPAFITHLPEADIHADSIRGWILQGENQQVVFFDIEAGATVPAHSHGEQWGVVVEGEMELTVEGETRTFRAGDSYHIRAGALHSAAFRTRFRAIDVFADPARYQTRHHYREAQ